MTCVVRLWASLVLLASIQSRALAADPEELIREGNELRRTGQNQRALPLYRRAYELSPTPRTAGQLGLAELATERYVEADSHLVEGLRSRTDPWVVKYRQTLEQALATVRSRVAHVEVTGNPDGATVNVNARPVGQLPRTPTVAVNPGRVEIEVSLNQYETLREVRELAPGAHEAIEVRLRARPTTMVETKKPPKPVPPPANGMTTAAVVLGASGILVAGTGVALRMVGDGKRTRIDEDAKAGRPYDPANGNWQSLNRASTACLIGGGAVVAGGIALWFFGRNDATAVGIAPTMDGGGLTLTGSF